MSRCFIIRTFMSRFFMPFTLVPHFHFSHFQSPLRFSCSDCLIRPPVHRSTVDSRAFSVAGPQVWNCLPPEVTSAPSLWRPSALDSRRSCSPSHILTFGSSDSFVSTQCLQWT